MDEFIERIIISTNTAEYLQGKFCWNSKINFSQQYFLLVSVSGNIISIQYDTW